MENRGRLSEAHLLKHFPFAEVRPVQLGMVKAIAKHGSVVLEGPTGSGKSAIGYAVLKASQSIGKMPLRIIVPTKSVAEQFVAAYPEMKAVFGRGENPCYFYNEEKDDLTPDTAKFNADEIPCAILYSCPHRVNLETGETMEEGAVPCPYLLAKYRAKRTKDIVVSTMAYHVFNGGLFGQTEEEKENSVLVIDEAHRFADVVRGVLSSTITDYHLSRAADILDRVEGEQEAKDLRAFRKALVSMVMKRQPRGEPLLKDQEIAKLFDMVDRIDYKKLQVLLKTAVQTGIVNPMEDRETLNGLQGLVRDVKRYLMAFRYALPEGKRNPLNYIYAACAGTVEEVKEEGKKVRCSLVVKCYHVAPLIRKMLAPTTIAFSATIGDPRIFGYESGIELPFESFESDFPVDRTAIYSPTDTPDLSHKARPKGEPNKTFRRIARAILAFKKKGYRSLVIVVSNEERLKFEALAIEEGVRVLTYHEDMKPREAVQAFKDGLGDALLGTEAHFGEGIDLPDGTAPVTFVLRPGYPSPNDPGAKFEEQRYGSGGVWSVRKYRVIIKALQVRGRNIRSAKDRGVTFFISQQFKGFVRHSLPKWLEKSYEGRKTFDECVTHAMEVLGRK